MKKQLTVALGLAVLATPAFATKARLQSLGENVNGSFYVNDNRNIFLNPAQVNNHRDLVTYELGSADQATETTLNPRAEGGVFKQVGNLVWGLQFGAASDTSNAFRAATGAAFLEESNNLDLFVGGDTGLKWGANVSYTDSSDDEVAGQGNPSDPTQSALRTKFGVIMGDTQAYAQLNLENKAETAAGDEFDGDLGYRLGVIHAWNGYSLFADWQSLDAEFDPIAAGPTRDISTSRIEVGAGRVTRLNDRANLFTRVSYVDTSVENEVNTGTVDFGGACTTANPYGCEEYGSKTLPVVAGLEVEATSWLTVRASVAQNLWGKEEDKRNERPLNQTTVVNAGATLKFGELSVDGVIGNTATAAVVGDDTSAGAGTLRTDVLMTRVGMVYRF